MSQIHNTIPNPKYTELVSVRESTENIYLPINDQLKSVITQLELSFEGSYPSYYAGYDFNEDHLIILIIGEDTLDYKKEFITRLDGYPFSIKKGKYPYQELLNVKKEIAEYKDTHKDHAIAQNIEYFGIRGNKVIVLLKDDSFQKRADFRREVTDSPIIGLTKKHIYHCGIAE